MYPRASHGSLFSPFFRLVDTRKFHAPYFPIQEVFLFFGEVPIQELLLGAFGLNIVKLQKNSEDYREN